MQLYSSRTNHTSIQLRAAATIQKTTLSTPPSHFYPIFAKLQVYISDFKSMIWDSCEFCKQRLHDLLFSRLNRLCYSKPQSNSYVLWLVVTTASFKKRTKITSSRTCVQVL